MLLSVLAIGLGFVGQAATQPTINPSFIASITANADESTLLQLIDQDPSVTVLPGPNARFQQMKIYMWLSGERLDSTSLTR